MGWRPQQETGRSLSCFREEGTCVGDRGSGDSGWPGAKSGVKYGISVGFRVELEL